MKATEVTVETARHLLRYDPETGAMTWRISKGAAPAGAVAGSKHRRGYWDVCIEGRRYGAHRLAWLIVHGVWPFGEIDHLNGDASDNRLANLRDVTHAVNTQNIRAAHRRNRSSGLLGVRKCSGGNRFEASIRVDRRHRTIGYFDTPEAAHAAYVAAKRRLHDGCTL